MFKAVETENSLSLHFLAASSSNALSLEAARELNQLQKKYKNLKRPVIVSSAHAKMFCSGGNLKDYAQLRTKAQGLKINLEITKRLNEFANWPVLKLALIDGDVLGGGMEWLACFDARFCSPYAFFSFWQRRIGLSPGWGGGARWSKVLGEVAVKKLLSEAELLSPEKAMALGIVDRIVCSWKLPEAAAEWAHRAHTLPGREVSRWSAKSEAKLFQELWLGADHKKALAKWKKS